MKAMQSQVTSEQKFVKDSILIFAINRLREARNEDIELDADIEVAVSLGQIPGTNRALGLSAISDAINRHTCLSELMGLDSDEFISLIGMHFNVKTFLDETTNPYELEPFFKVCNDLMDEFLETLLTK